MTLITAALKEWSAVISAAGAGDQIVLVRKGGIGEKRFELPAERFVLFPTRFHEGENQFHPRFSHHVDAGASSSGEDSVTVQWWAEAVAVHRVEELERLMRIAPFVIFTDATVRDRYTFRPRQAMHVIAIRAYRLPEPVRVPLMPEYAGCRSWTDLAQPVSTDGSVPVLDDAEFAARLDALEAALSDPAPTPANS